jgi:hypothetical protein
LELKGPYVIVFIVIRHVRFGSPQEFRARHCLAIREFAKARQTLEAIIVRVPKAVCPRVFLSHVLLQEGRDWSAAESTLRDILALDSDNAEAKSNLDVLLRQQRRQPA